MTQKTYSYIQYTKDGCPEHLVIPEGYTAIEKDMLNDYFSDGVRSEKPTDRLKSLVLPKTMQRIEDEAFISCKNLESITFSDPDSRMEIGARAFANCSKLKNVEVPLQAKNRFKAFPEKALRALKEFTKEDYEKLADKENVVIPEGYEKIADGAFANSHVSSVKMPESMKAIGNGAFEGCFYLTEINIPDSVMAIGYDAFRNCQCLASVTLPEKLEVIPQRIFCDCKSLKTLNVPERVTTISGYAFENSGITAIHLPDSMRILCPNSLACCEHLTELTGPGNMYVDFFAISQSKNLKNIELRGEISHGCVELFRNDLSKVVLLFDKKALLQIISPTLAEALNSYKEAGDFSRFTEVKEKLEQASSANIRKVLNKIEVLAAEEKERKTKEVEREKGKERGDDGPGNM